MIIKLILICLSNSFFNFFIKMKNELYFVFHFFMKMKMKNELKVLKIQRKNLLNMKMVVSYLNFVFFIKVKSNSKYWILNFAFQFIKKKPEMAIWVHGFFDHLSILLFDFYEHMASSFSSGHCLNIEILKKDKSIMYALWRS